MEKLSPVTIIDHFGSPSTLLQEKIAVMFLSELEHVVWPYFVKYFLMLKTIQNYCFEKQQPVQLNSRYTLLGQAAPWQTVFLTNYVYMVHNSKQFHSIIEDRRICSLLNRTGQV